MGVPVHNRCQQISVSESVTYIGTILYCVSAISAQVDIRYVSHHKLPVILFTHIMYDFVTTTVIP